MTKNQENLLLNNQDSCPVCLGNGVAEIRNCWDFLKEKQRTETNCIWTYFRCFTCKSLWLHSQPDRSQIAICYDFDYMTHAAPQKPLEPPSGLRSKLIFNLKLAYLSEILGYTSVAEKFPIQSLYKNLVHLLKHFSPARAYLGDLVRHVPYKNGGRLLDLGCGNGSYLLLMRELGWQVVGIEPDKLAYQQATEQNLEVQSLSLEEIDFPPHSFDAITMSHVFEHLYNPQETVRKLTQLLKPGGILVSISPNPQSFNTCKFQRYWRGLEPPRHLSIPSIAGYQHLSSLVGGICHISTSTKLFRFLYRDSMSIKKIGSPGGNYSWQTAQALEPLILLWSLLDQKIGDEIIFSLTCQTSPSSTRES